MNNISFFYNRNIIHPSLNISPKKYSEEWNNEFSNLIDYFSNKFFKSISKIENVQQEQIKIYSKDIEYVDNFKLENTIKLCEFFNFSLLATELEYYYVITLNNSIQQEENTQFKNLIKYFKTEIYSKNENKYNIPCMFFDDYLEVKKEIRETKKENILNTYPINFINKIPQNEFV